MKLTKEMLDSVRNIDGFPIGSDEDIIELSDPPHYTACPNPFINDFIEKYGKPYDEETDDYKCEPYAADVSEGKNDPIYNAHSYHTKVPHKAIMRYILHYTKPGDIVFDGFCGTGMTGVAAQMCGNPDPEFKFKVEKESEKEGKKVEWGARRAILGDLSPAATFIAYNYNTPVDTAEFEKEAKRILDEVENECGWMYETIHTIDGVPQKYIDGSVIKGRINYTVWSDVFVCPNCSNEIVFWDAAVNKEDGKVMDEFKCPHCGAAVNKKDLDRAWKTVYDKALDKVINQVKQVPVLINYTVDNKRYEKKPDEFDMELIEKIEEMDIPYWYPTDELPNGYNTEQPKKSHGITHVHHFYTKRNLWVLSAIYDRIKMKKNIFYWLLTSVSEGSSKLNRERPNGLPSKLSGTLYVSSMIHEINNIDFIYRKIMKRILNKELSSPYNKCISTQSLDDIKNIKSNSVDYIFTDPPFGDNLMYSELNFLWESWLKIFTNNKTEAIINKTQKKGLHEYQELMEKCFSEMYRILKPGRWMTVEFHNSKNAVWNAIQEAILRAGFVIANVRTLDKKQGSFKQVTTTTAVKQDLVISAYKPKEGFVKRFLKEAGTEEGVWDFVSQHLEKLPIVVEVGDRLDIVDERRDYLLYDSMIAFHIQNGASIPMGSSDFYAGLKKRYIERDGMYFLPDQAAVYDSKRAKLELNDQLSFIIKDEKMAIQWLKYKLLNKPMTYQELQPLFLEELHQGKHESIPELIDILQENFLKDDDGRWYVPDVNRQSDMEKLREKKLLKDFEEYKNSKGKLKIFRSEAIRVGFKECWKNKDYETIVSVSERLPESFLQEDQTLLMYYDNAQTRLGV
ncbi:MULTISPECIES: DNA methyltransferase [Thermoanaerobacterium]|uniref:DNA methylase N-4/N-6 domain-containing protein n=2 Tax=Thermoanaerobacterium TaxID=28895 RepID=W9EF13_9THEO|nr:MULTISPECIES: DNA methyltransferase [Thermoanaerobacterium]AFK87282.1 DNA methylase N-4/N-6 domain protein [Thermoanaerobacterium saccharolyticum JW/SL-YS485]ETO39580.1 DNA methylase N-4/N-6 domain-containing protein [Thermoanaerobacterium aotearoense SCUT27]